MTTAYRAIGDGKIWLDTEKTIPAETLRQLDEVFDYVDTYLGIDEPYIYVSKMPNAFDEASMYDEAETRRILELLSPYATAAMIDLNDGEGHYWRFAFVDDRWEKQEGTMVYTIAEAEQFIKRHASGSF